MKFNPVWINFLTWRNTKVSTFPAGEIYRSPGCFLTTELYDDFGTVFFPSQCGFWKGFRAQHCLLVIIEKFKEAIDRGMSLVLSWLTFSKYLIV